MGFKPRTTGVGVTCSELSTSRVSPALTAVSIWPVWLMTPRKAERLQHEKQQCSHFEVTTTWTSVLFHTVFVCMQFFGGPAAPTTRPRAPMVMHSTSVLLGQRGTTRRTGYKCGGAGSIQEPLVSVSRALPLCWNLLRSVQATNSDC